MPKHGIKITDMKEYPIKRLPGHLYYIDKAGYVWASPMKNVMPKKG